MHNFGLSCAIELINCFVQPKPSKTRIFVMNWNTRPPQMIQKRYIWTVAAQIAFCGVAHAEEEPQVLETVVVEVPKAPGGYMPLPPVLPSVVIDADGGGGNDLSPVGIFSGLKPAVSACSAVSPSPDKNRDIRNTTSRDEPAVRGVAADAIIRSVAPGLSLNGKNVKVIYSDGGSETVKFNFFGTTQVAEGKDYSPGSGKSKCPVS